MKAAVMRATRTPLSLEDVPIPQIEPDEVLIETRTSGICGTDLHILDGHGYVPPLPHILGHEPAGVVAEVGRNVSGFRSGDRVVPHLFITCDQCYYCRGNRHQQCTRLKGIIGVLSNGAFAEYFKAPVKNLFKLPETVAFDAGGLIADAVVTAVHATQRAPLREGDSAVVLGAGGVGQILIQLLRSAKIRVAAVDVSTPKLELAEELGADLAIDGRADDAKRAVRQFSQNGGVQCVFNCVGTAVSMRQSADFVMRCGRIVVIGEEPEFPQLDTIEVAQQELEIIGSRNGTRQDMKDAVRYIETGVVKPFVAARFPLAHVNAAFDCMRTGALGRIVVVIKE
jgi:D-arabinose 1-dehydrogenase-like Zn-dependent alcohol dehydrogenase